jgi:hypothetical protein
LPTVRWRKNESGYKFVLCNACLDTPLRSYVWIVPGDFSIMARCDGCGRYCNPREIAPATLRQGGYKRDVYTGLCEECVG